MVSCACGKPIDKVPNWLQSAKVEFVCNNCPNRQTKNIAFVSLEAGVKDAGTQIEGEPDLGDLDEDED
ncbi:MAG: hypothetical protein CBB60_004260 [Armatimonadetes bacterium Cent15-Ar3]|nr:MAG: hypothetical protein CBB60_004260 [Armatimonadetes bacterium Cent15-Ar3]